MTRYIVLTLLLFFGTGSALCPPSGPHRLEGGPSLYRLERRREGGSQQRGTMAGLEVRYERLRPWGFYWCGAFSGGGGRLYGRTGLGDPIRSDFYELAIEGRLGYAVGWRAFTIAPFAGWGYYVSRNVFLRPSPLTIHVKNELQYPLAGLVLEVTCSDYWTVAVRGQLAWIVDGSSEITHDPWYDDETLTIGEKIHYSIELPLRYHRCSCGYGWSATLVPFYRERCLGGLLQFPVDFIETTFESFGAYMTLGYGF